MFIEANIKLEYTLYLQDLKNYLEERQYDFTNKEKLQNGILDFLLDNQNLPLELFNNSGKIVNELAEFFLIKTID